MQLMTLTSKMLYFLISNITVDSLSFFIEFGPKTALNDRYMLKCTI